MKQKYLTLLLVLVLVLQLLPFGMSQVAAEGADDRVVRLLVALDIMGVDSSTGLFWDETPVRRGEIAEILCKLLGLEATTESEPKFYDVGERDRAYVETIVRNGYMSGYGDVIFGVDDYVTNEQLIKIFVTLVGGGELAEREGGYPNGYIYVGKKLGIIKGAVASLGSVSRRIDVASIIYEAINTDMIVLSGMSDDKAMFASEEGETFLTEALKIYKGDGIISKSEGTSLNRPDGAGEGMVQVGDTVYLDSKRLTDDYLGCNVIVYAKKDELSALGDIVYVEEDKNNESILIDDKDIISVDQNSITYNSDNKPKTLRISYIADMVYNGKAVVCDMKRADIKNGYVKVIDNDGDKAYDVVLVTEYKSFVVDRAVEAEEKLLLQFGEPAIELEESLYRIFRDGVATEIKDIGTGDVILAAISENTEGEKVVRIEASTLCIMGSVTKTHIADGKTYVTVSGEEFVISDYYANLVSQKLAKDITAGDSGQFFVDTRGAVVYFSGGEGGNVGYLIDSSFDDNVFSSTLMVKLYTLDKNIETYKTADKIVINGEKMDVSDIKKSENLLAQFNKPQLIKYYLSDNVLNEVVFAVDGYDLQNFSCDVDATVTCTNTAVLDNKYDLSAGTKIFYVPNVESDSEGYQEIINNVAHYNIYTSSYFIIDGTYNTALYDVAQDGTVEYAMVRSDPKNASISEGTAMIAVTEVGDGIDDKGDMIKVIKGLSESSAEVEFKAVDEEVITDSTLNRIPKMGDVIQYTTNSTGYIRGIKILHSVDEEEYYTPTSITSASSCRTKKVYGEVAINNGLRMLISCEPIWGNMSPTDTNKTVSDNGTAVLRYDRERKKLTTADFAEIERGEKVFVCVAGSNKTRMLIIYD